MLLYCRVVAKSLAKRASPHGAVASERRSGGGRKLLNV
jgi:hypothetical protein